MKTTLCVLVAAALLATACAASTPTTSEDKPMQDTPTLELLADPAWEATRLHGETIFFLRHEGDARPRGRLLYPAASIDRVYNARDLNEYNEGADYVVLEDGRTIELPEGSTIPFREASELFQPAESPGAIGHRVDDPGTWLLFGGRGVFHPNHVAFDYKVGRGAKAIDAPQAQGALLPRTAAKLAAGEPLHVLLLGDSISAGADASGLLDEPPGQPSYGPLVAQALGEKHGCDVTFTNLSVGGMVSTWGVEQAPAAAGHQPDLMIIAFGMNDASHAMPTETFIGNIREIMRVVGESSPQTEFVLVVGMLSNPEWVMGRHAFHAMHREALLAEAREGVAVADMASVWKEMVTLKDLHSLTGNGVNHPNDFGHRVYAQVVLATMGE